ncbi:MAG: hypothetical protein AAF607_06760 [Pseudomonadota bacterium]
MAADVQKADIIAQFEHRLIVMNGSDQAIARATWMLPQQAYGHGSGPDYPVFLHKVEFAQPPTRPALTTDLFALAAPEDVLKVRATWGDRRDVATLSKSAPSHQFFKSSAGGSNR